MNKLQIRFYSQRVINEFTHQTVTSKCRFNLYKLNFIDMNKNNNSDKSLSSDGYYDYLQPYKLSDKFEKQFQRRLWLGGSIKIDDYLNVGDEKLSLKMVETLDKVRNLRQKAVVTTTRKVIDLANQKTLLTENRDIYYTNELYRQNKNSNPDEFDKSDFDFKSKEMTFSASDIKEFSHRTENPHYIHLNSTYNQVSEGFPKKLVVQGPYLLYETIKFLTAELNIDYVSRIDYRLNAVVFEGDRVSIKLNKKTQQLVLGNASKGICLTLKYSV